MQQTEITILETSDIHGQINPIHYATNEEASYGLARIATLVKEERKKSNNVILIDNGDLIQGTPFIYHYMKLQSEQPNPMILTANSMEYDAAVFGNHEFNYGLNILGEAVRQSRFPWLSATILDQTTGEPYFGKPYVIKELESGIRIAILGLTTTYIPHWEKEEHIEGLRFLDAVEAAKRWVPYLKEQADLVVVSYHGGFERDLETGEPSEELTGENQGYQICQEVPGIDVLLTGHQHREIVEKSINGVLIMQPGSKGTALSKVTVEMQSNQNGEWSILNKGSELIEASRAEADTGIVQLVSKYEEAAQAWLDRPIGKIQGDMVVRDPMEIRLKDSSLIRFINEIQMEAAGTDISNTSLFNNEVPGFPERVTMRDVMANYIYPNTLKVLRISGRDMREALEQSASYFEQYNGERVRINKAFYHPKPQHYNYDMWTGIEYEINISRPIGERVVKLEYKGQPVLLENKFDVVMNNYRAGGGGNYFMYMKRPVIKEVPIDVSELIADYFLKYEVVRAKSANGWQVIHD